MVDLYRLYGEELAVRGTAERLAAVPGTGPAGVLLDMGGLPNWLESEPLQAWHVSEEHRADGLPKLAVYRTPGRPYLVFSYRHGIRFVVREDGREMWGEWPRRYRLSYVEPMILGPVMGAALRLMGVSTLHASVVEMRGHCIAIMGPGGAGKSTTAGAFAKLGYGILSDDLAPIRRRDGRFFVAPGYPRICLWPSSVEILFGAPDALPPISEDWEKRYLSLPDHGLRFCESERELRAIYWIAERSDEALPEVSTLPAQQALLHLAGNTYGVELPDLQMAARDMRLYAELLRHVPVRRLVTSGDPALLPLLCEKIAEDFDHVLG